MVARQIEENMEMNETMDQEIEVPCINCPITTCHVILQSVDFHGKKDMGDGDWFSWDNHWQIIQCKGCNSISFRHIHSNSEDYIQVDHEDFDVKIYEKLYPNRLAGRNKLKYVYLIPSNVREIYKETIHSLVNGQKVITGIGIRAIIEAICKDKSAMGSDLYNKINSLVDKGMLTHDGAEILHKLRILGNKAAHEVKPHNEEQLALAIEAVEHLLEGAYIFPKKIKEAFSEEE